MDAKLDDVCLQSANLSWKDQAVVNWEAKENVTSALEAGTVITRAVACGGADSAIYTHTEGQLSARVQANVTDITAVRDQLRDAVLNKNSSVAADTAAAS